MSDRIDQLNAAFAGRYEVVEPVGEGGHATVYLARQLQPVRRSVALKVLRSGPDSVEILKRFASERRALALMDDRGVAKILDAGVVDGRPYFAMELVEGTRITDFSDRRQLTIRERLALFVDVCHAVQHAHRKGIIHRDLKPSNVLVAEVDGTPTPRVMDFGIAKSSGTGEFDGARLTRAGQVIGTPAYMSPEQLGGAAEVDQRTDVYALGVVLYELLVGTLPYPAEAYRGWGALAAISSGDAPLASRRLADCGQALATIADRRKTTPKALRAELRGDLERVVAKAMAPEPSDRYQSPDGLALALGRYLAGEPAPAGRTPAWRSLLTVVPPERTYSRVAAGLLATVVAGVAMATTAMVMANQAQAAANAEAEAARAVNVFLQSVLGTAGSSLERDARQEATIVDALERAVPTIAWTFSDQPLLAASVRTTVGVIFLESDRFALADALLRDGLRTREALLGPGHRDVGRSLHYLGVLSRLQGEPVIAEQLLSRSMRIFREELGDAHELSTEALAEYALVLLDLRRYDEAVQAAERVMDLTAARHDGPHREVAEALDRLGRVHYRRLLSCQRGQRTPDLTCPSFRWTLDSSLGPARIAVWDFDDAIQPLERAVEMNRGLLASAASGEDFAIRTTLITSLTDLVLAYRARGDIAAGDVERAAELEAEALALRAERTGPEPEWRRRSGT